TGGAGQGPGVFLDTGAALSHPLLLAGGLGAAPAQGVEGLLAGGWRAAVGADPGCTSAPGSAGFSGGRTRRGGPPGGPGGLTAGREALRNVDVAISAVAGRVSARDDRRLRRRPRRGSHPPLEAAPRPVHTGPPVRWWGWLLISTFACRTETDSDAAADGRGGRRDRAGLSQTTGAASSARTEAVRTAGHRRVAPGASLACARPGRGLTDPYEPASRGPRAAASTAAMVGDSINRLATESSTTATARARSTRPR
ncbi:hypothetical protein BX283_8042, partial [Streptomyces sp. TLI_146]